EALDLGDMLVLNADTRTVFEHQRPPAGLADDIADVVAYHGRDPAQHQDPVEIELAARGEDGARDHQGFTRRRQPEALEEHAQEPGGVAVVADVALGLADEAVEHRGGSRDRGPSVPRSEPGASSRDARERRGSRRIARA